MTDDSKDQILFHPLKDYSFPAEPADEKVLTIYSRIKDAFTKEKMSSLIDESNLESLKKRKLNKAAPSPAYGSLIKELDNTLRPWIEQDSPANWTQIIVLPPCESDNLVHLWADGQDCHIIKPPSRNVFTDGSEADISLPKDKLLVLPRLEDWFLRHEKGLGPLRQILEKITEMETPCVIGCNSWAWAYFSKVLKLDMMFAAPLTPKAFDEDRLAKWLQEIAHEGDHNFVFRLLKTGENVFEKNDNETLKKDYIKRLAAKSLGIPWVAWHLWRDGLKSDTDSDPEDFPESLDIPADEKTVWVEPFTPYKLPTHYHDHSLFLLQAIVMHNTLSLSEIALIMPEKNWHNSLAALVNAEIIIREDDQVRCNPSAYPAMRTALLSNGLPVGDI
tara:strand:- start:279 stop:1445 length:1167 start_codon:yes stop_codon:yes gene_type:complete